MALLIGGNPRSGTTLLCWLLDSHPDISLTFEFGNYRFLNLPGRKHTKDAKAFAGRKTSQAIVRFREAFHTKQDLKVVVKANRKFLFWYTVHFRLLFLKSVKAADVDFVLRKTFSNTKIVGDKYPGYVFNLDRLVLEPDVDLVIIYRDCRDVVSSVLKKVRGDWKGRRWTSKIDTAAKAAQRWVQAIEIMEKHAERINLVRYEQLVASPAEVLRGLAVRLGIEPEAFQTGDVHGESLGKHRSYLTPEEIRDIEEIAGPTMHRLGYV